MEQKSVGRLIGEISRAALTYFNHKFKPYNIGHAQLRTLVYISQHEGLTQMELAKTLRLDKSSVTSQIQILEKNGYIFRQTSTTDARKQVISITDKTREVITPIKKVLSSWTEILLDGFSDNERNELFSYLERIRENARNGIKNIQTDKY